MTEEKNKTKPKEKESNKVFDVAKPGETAASGTSRPVIVGHKQMLKQDPMMVGEDAKDEEELTRKPETKIEPLITPDANAEPNNAVVPEKSETKAEDAPLASPDEESADTTNGAVDALAGEASTKRQMTKEAEEAQKKNEEIEKLIASKQYFIKTKVPSGKRNTRWLVTLFMLIVAGTAAFFLIGPGKDMWAKQDPIPTSQIPQPTIKQEQKPATTVPALSEFFNPDLGVSFKYPSEWGDAQVQDNVKTATEKGKRVLITFAKNKTVTAGMKSKDWTDSSKDVNADCAQPGFIVFLLEKTNKNNGKTVLLEKPDLQVYEELTGGLCNDTQVVANKKFTTNKVYMGLQVWQQAKTDDKFELAQRIADYQKFPDKYFSGQQREQITTAIESAKEL